MAVTIRPFADVDLPAVVELSLAAWAPVFASVERWLAGSGVFEAQHPDWRSDQRAAVENACRDADQHVRVAEIDRAVAGFVVVGCRADEPIGEIHMVAVDPAHQRRVSVGRWSTPPWTGSSGRVSPRRWSRRRATRDTPRHAGSTRAPASPRSRSSGTSGRCDAGCSEGAGRATPRGR